MSASHFCAIDFGTSNSAVAIQLNQTEKPTLIALEPGRTTIPTAVFYGLEGGARLYGRAAVDAYTSGHDGRLMRSMKTILGSDLADQTTEIGEGYSIRFMHVIESYLQHLKQKAVEAAKTDIQRVVLGRPVFFVDGHPTRDAKAQAGLEAAARAVGFKEIHFQFEPIAAALDYESNLTHEEVILVADIGGGTSDFSVVRVSPERREKTDRKQDVLANHGVHIAGTDFDQSVNVSAIMPQLGLGSALASASDRSVPSSVYHEFATWHLINTLYSPRVMADLKQTRSMYADQAMFDRLLRALSLRLGHQLAACAEQAKIDAASGTKAKIDLHQIESKLSASLTPTQLNRAIQAQVSKIVDAAKQAVKDSGLVAQQIDTIYFTGGSTGLTLLCSEIAKPFAQAKVMFGDRFASVGYGLGLTAARLFSKR
jgi:hypothetical chaperone protein